MDKLWAPWRIRYIKAKKTKACIFCQAKKQPRKHYVVYSTECSIVLLNIYPYNNGHLMIAPCRHIKDIESLSEKEMLDLIKVLAYTKKLLDKVLRPQGYNIGINISEIAGAGITGHLHIHIVPRWKADTNFMPVIFDTKIISQSLIELYKELKDAQAKMR